MRNFVTEAGGAIFVDMNPDFRCWTDVEIFAMIGTSIWTAARINYALNTRRLGRDWRTLSRTYKDAHLMLIPAHRANLAIDRCVFAENTAHEEGGAVAWRWGPDL